MAKDFSSLWDDREIFLRQREIQVRRWLVLRKCGIIMEMVLIEAKQVVESGHTFWGYLCLAHRPEGNGLCPQQGLRGDERVPVLGTKETCMNQESVNCEEWPSCLTRRRSPLWEQFCRSSAALGTGGGKGEGDAQEWKQKVWVFVGRLSSESEESRLGLARQAGGTPGSRGELVCV